MMIVLVALFQVQIVCCYLSPSEMGSSVHFTFSKVSPSRYEFWVASLRQRSESYSHWVWGWLTYQGIPSSSRKSWIAIKSSLVKWHERLKHMLFGWLRHWPRVKLLYGSQTRDNMVSGPSVFSSKPTNEVVNPEQLYSIKMKTWLRVRPIRKRGSSHKCPSIRLPPRECCWYMFLLAIIASSIPNSQVPNSNVKHNQGKTCHDIVNQRPKYPKHQRSGIAPMYKVRYLEETRRCRSDCGPSRLMYNLARKFLPAGSSERPVTTAWEESLSTLLGSYEASTKTRDGFSGEHHFSLTHHILN